MTWREAAREGRYKPGFLRELEKMKVLRPEKFKMEFEAEFIEDVDSWLTQDLLAKACSEELEYIPFEASPEGEFYAGIDPSRTRRLQRNSRGSKGRRRAEAGAHETLPLEPR